MKTKLFTLFLALVASVGSIFASNTQVDGIWYDFDNSTMTATVTYRGSYSSEYSNQYTGSVVIPASVVYNDKIYNVTSIGNSAFHWCGGLTNVTIPNSVTSIGVQAFSECSGLTNVTIPNSVTSIGDYAFYYCSGLTSVTIGNNVTSIGAAAFGGCSNLTSVTIPNSVTSIGDWAFLGCSELTSIEVEEGNTNYDSRDNCNAIIETSTNTLITGCKNSAIPNSVTSIEAGAFYGCSGLTSVTIGNSVTSIGESAFSYCSGLTSITIANSVTSIETDAFSNCSGLTSVVWNAKNCNGYNFGSQVTSFTFGNEVEIIPSSICSGMKLLTSITIPNSVISIGNAAFDGCSSLTSVTIPNNVTSIGTSAFQGCSSLTSVTIPNNVTNIGKSAFQSCSSLTSVTLNSSAIVGKDYTSPSSSNKDIFGSQVIEYIIGDDVTGIGKGAFRACSRLTSVTIGKNVINIGSEAFLNCIPLSNVTINSEVPATIGMSAFCYEHGNSSITYIDILPDLNIYVPCGALEGYKQATEWSIYSQQMHNHLSPVQTESANEGMGYVSVASLCDTTIEAYPNEGYAFVQWLDGNTDNPRVINPEDTVTYVAEFDFVRTGKCGKDWALTWSYDKLTRTLTISGEGAFEENMQCGLEARANLTYLVFEDGVTSIGENAFKNCFGLKKVSIGNSVKSIGWFAFRNCSNLVSVIIGTSVSGIGDYAFADCTRLSELIIPNSVTRIGDHAFYECDSLKSITIPNSITSIGYDAFDRCKNISEIHYIGNFDDWCTKSWSPSQISSAYDLFFENDTVISVVIPNNLTSVRDSLFIGCKSIKDVTILNNVKTIGVGAFRNCTNLASVSIGNGVTNIGQAAFVNCAQLKDIVLGSSVKLLEIASFSRCSAIETITCYSQRPPTIASDAWSGSALSDVPYSTIVYVPADYLNTYKMHDAWGLYDVRPLGAVSTQTTNVQITPTDYTANVVWPSVENAATYELVIKDKNGNIICTLIFNASGQLTEIAFSAPGRNDATEQTQGAGFSFTVTGLDSDTDYDLTITAKDANGNAINTVTQSFTTTGGQSAIDEALTESQHLRKEVKDGQLFITFPNGTRYTATGVKVE